MVHVHNLTKEITNVGKTSKGTSIQRFSSNQIDSKSYASQMDKMSRKKLFSSDIIFISLAE